MVDVCRQTLPVLCNGGQIRIKVLGSETKKQRHSIKSKRPCLQHWPNFWKKYFGSAPFARVGQETRDIR